MLETRVRGGGGVGEREPPPSPRLASWEPDCLIYNPRRAKKRKAALPQARLSPLLKSILQFTAIISWLTGDQTWIMEATNYKNKLPFLTCL